MPDEELALVLDSVDELVARWQQSPLRFVLEESVAADRELLMLLAAKRAMLQDPGPPGPVTAARLLPVVAAVSTLEAAVRRSLAFWSRVFPTLNELLP